MSVVWGAGGDSSCNHKWIYSHNGVDGASIFECSKCGAREKRM